MDLRDTYNLIAKDWHEDHKKDDWWVEGTDKFASLFEKDSEILDVGCAGGLKSDYLREKGLRVTGIDLSKNLIEIAKREYPRNEFMVMDMRELGSLKRTFDGVFAQASLLHIPKKEAGDVLKNLASKLKSEGYLYVAVKGSKLGKPEEEIKEENDYGYTYERFFSYFSLDELKTYFKNLGLTIVYENTNAVGKTDWIQVIGRKS